jgi:hypothetical protein
MSHLPPTLVAVGHDTVGRRVVPAAIERWRIRHGRHDARVLLASTTSVGVPVATGAVR